MPSSSVIARAPSLWHAFIPDLGVEAAATSVVDDDDDGVTAGLGISGVEAGGGIGASGVEDGFLTGASGAGVGSSEGGGGDAEEVGA